MSALVEKLVGEETGGKAEPDWLVEARREARRALMRDGFPDARTEDWKYTSLKLLEKRSLTESEGTEREPLPDLPAGGLVLDFFNGRLQVPDDLPAGVRIYPLREAQGPKGLVGDYGGREAAFAWLNTARFEEGWVLDIQRELSEPVLLVSRTTADFSGVVHPRLTVRLAPDASAQLVEMQLGQGSGLCNWLTGIELGRDSRLDHCRLQHAGNDSLLIQRNDVTVAGGGRYNWISVDLGGRLGRHDLNIDLIEAEAGCQVDGVFVADGRAHLDHHTRIDHRVGPSYSEENFRGLLSGRSRGVFNGKIVVHKGADGSASEMNNANLLLSEHAEIDTKPELEIYADEVTAAHGATVGQLDSDALFYLQSRGIPASQARMLLKQAFARTIVEKVRPEAFRDDWLERLAGVVE